MTISKHASTWIERMARTGLVAKGLVYCILGILAFMSAFEIAGQADDKADKQGVFEAVRDKGGNFLLALLVIGLTCYSLWRLFEAVRKHEENNEKRSAKKRVRYLSSGITYLSATVFAGKVLFNKNKSGGGSSKMLSKLLHESYGQWLVGLFAAVIVGVGLYQIYYGVSEKYKKHVDNLNLGQRTAGLLLTSGKVGYVARGFVWILLAWLLFKAALHANSNEAGDSGKAFQFLESSSYGSYLLGALSVGLICYGIFNFIRSRYEGFAAYER
jgi:hypothetical protein